MINKLLRSLMVVGISLCLLCIVYMIYVTAFERAATKIKTSGDKTMLIAAGFVAVTEGDVVRVGDERTIIQYYHEWDGTDYKHVIHHENVDYPENTKVPVVYSVGMGIGSCLVVGFYRKRILLWGIVGLVMSGVGFIINLIRKGIGTWQEERL